MEGSLEEKKLELRLGPPGEEEEENWTTKINSRERNESLLSVGCFSNSGSQTRKFSSSENPFRHFQTAPKSMTVMEKELSQHCYTRVADMNNSEKKAFSPVAAYTAVPNSSHKRRTASTPVVGWPPVRSFRKNLSSISSSKPQCQLQNVISDKFDSRKPIESCQKGLFVKINMDGVPIGRKVDLKAYESYEKLSYCVDELFRGLLAAQENQNKQSGGKSITGLSDGSGDYTLVYEDNEGDRMLVGDVPWHMFVSTVKRLWVLKSSELSTLSVGSKQEKR